MQFTYHTYSRSSFCDEITIMIRRYVIHLKLKHPTICVITNHKSAEKHARKCWRHQECLSVKSTWYDLNLYKCLHVFISCCTYKKISHCCFVLMIIANKNPSYIACFGCSSGIILIFPLYWIFCRYLREERLEIQLWISYNQDQPGQDQPRPRHRDKLIGCAYIDLSPLTDKRSKHHRVR